MPRQVFYSFYRACRILAFGSYIRPTARVLLPDELALFLGVDLLHAFDRVDSFEAVAEHHHVVLSLLLDDHADVGFAVVLALTLCPRKDVLQVGVRIKGKCLDRHECCQHHDWAQFLQFHVSFLPWVGRRTVHPQRFPLGA